MTDRMIRVWRFAHAPAEYQALSPHGGDEDWVALLPASLNTNGFWVPWCEPGEESHNSSGFGCCRISSHRLPDGSEVRIGAHA